MSDSDASVHRMGALEALQNQSGSSRRQRPPNMERAHSDDNRVPLRHGNEKLAKRESKLGLRGLFSRNKNLSEADVNTFPRSGSSKSSGIRASLAEISNWPYGFQSTKSDVSLASPGASVDHRPKRPSPPPPGGGAPAPRPARTSVATWDPPPLFKAYPQAIKHASLPACTVSADALVRMQAQKGAGSLRDNLATPEPGEEFSIDHDRFRRKHRGNLSISSTKVEWTTKLYILVTSGYLLQYTGEGSFDRLPEKVLHLGPESAAFASDLIPGKHWTLQISSTMESDGTQTTDSRSLFTKLPFRVGERRHASNLLMVFDSADDMDSWIATLRREIEFLGGKKNLSETGKPRAEGQAPLRQQVSQRTLVVRDPARFSRVMTTEPGWDQQPRGPDSPYSPYEMPESDVSIDHAFGDGSATNSMISQDGRQLDGLRDSAARLSCMSSGQRTYITSEGSSPPCSPMRNSFASYSEDPVHQDLPPEIQARPRPNAAAIMDRRQSMRTVNSFVDFRIAQNPPPRPQSTYSSPLQEQESQFSNVTAPIVTRNFSVPQAVSKRFSLVKSNSSEPVVTTSPMYARFPPARISSRKPPPPTLGSSRPLSIVADQPSPAGTASPTSPLPPYTGHSDDLSTPETAQTHTPTYSETRSQHSSDYHSDKEPEAASHGPLAVPSDRVVHLSPKNDPTFSATAEFEAQQESRRFITPNTTFIPRTRPLMMPDIVEEPPRSRSSLDTYDRVRSKSPDHPGKPISKRSSMFTRASDSFGLSRSYQNQDHSPRMTSSPLSELPLRSAASAHFPRHVSAGAASPGHSHHLRVDELDKPLANRRSVSQLVVSGPPPVPPPSSALPSLPPAPPPSCALPPLPPPSCALPPLPPTAVDGRHVRMHNQF